MVEAVHEVFRRRVREFQASIAIETAERSLSYGELDRASDAIAAFLLSKATAPGARIAVLHVDSSDVIVAMLGVFKAGALFVPLDPELPERRLRAMLKVADPSWIICDAGSVGRIATLLQGRRGVSVLVPSGAGTFEPDAASIALHALPPDFSGTSGIEVGPDDACYLYFTSGSTGEPKAIVGRVKAVTHFVLWEIESLGFGPGARVSQLTTPVFDAFLRDVFTPLLCGGTVCVPPSRETVRDARGLARWIADSRIQFLHCVPSVLRAVLAQAGEVGRFPELRAVLVAGEPLHPADLTTWFRELGTRVELVNLYGPSETTMTKLFHRITREDADRAFVPIGKPMPGARAIVLDENGQPAGIGVVGEIYIRTPYRSLGYFRRPDLTQAAFVPNPLHRDPSDILYRTGDFGRMHEDGNFEFVGRRDRQVKIHGVRVELDEIEGVLREHAGVRDVAVVDRQHEDGTVALCAYIVSSPKVEAEALRRFATEALPEVTVPTLFVDMDILPRTLNGKIDRSQLPAPWQIERQKQVAYVAPRTPTEQALAEIWAELLEIGAPGVHANFFVVGGHSLLAMQVLSRVEAVFGVNISLRTFLNGANIATLAEAVELAILEAADMSSELSAPRQNPETPDATGEDEAAPGRNGRTR